MNRLFALAACAALTFSGMLSANEEITDLQARIASLEAKMMAPAASGDAESLMSLKKKGQVKIGGKVAFSLYNLRRDERDLGTIRSLATNARQANALIDLDTGTFEPGGAAAFGDTNDDGVIAHAGTSIGAGDSSFYQTYNWEAGLTFQVDINADTKAVIAFDLEEDDAEDLVEEVYLEFNKVRGSNWNIRIGKADMPFGQAHNPSITDNYVDGSDLLANYLVPGQTDNKANDDSNPHSTIGYATGNIQVADDNVIGVIAEYSWKNNLTLEMATYLDGVQGGLDNDEADGLNNNMYGDTSDPLFATYTARLTWMPTETLTTSISFMNSSENGGGLDEKLNTAAGRNVVDGSDYREDIRALSIAFTYDCKPLKTMFFGEYVANWNMNHEMNDADIWQLGATYAFSPKINIHAWGEYLHIDNDEQAARYSNLTINTNGRLDIDGDGTALSAGDAAEMKRLYNSSFDEDAKRLGLAADYTTDSGITFAVEYIYEWYNNDLSWYADSQAQQLAFQASYDF